VRAELTIQRADAVASYIAACSPHLKTTPVHTFHPFLPSAGGTSDPDPSLEDEMVHFLEAHKVGLVIGCDISRAQMVS